MKRSFYIVAGLVALVALGFLLFRRSPAAPVQGLREPHVANSKQAQPEHVTEQDVSAEVPAQGNTPVVPAPSSDAIATHAPDAAAFDRDEQGLLHMYDEMSDAIEMSTDDCDAIEYAFATAVEGGIPHLKVLIARAKESQRHGRAGAADPLHALAKERMQRLFMQLRKLPPDCGRQLSTELRKLTEGKF